jgi:RNA-directed DNA polymerase
VGYFIKKIKVHSLTGRINNDLMHKAFKAVKKNRGAAGVDKISIKMFEANLEENLSSLMRELKTGTFQPKPLRRVHVPKDENKTRPIGIPVVRDRVAQEVCRRLLEPIFEPLFLDASCGFRPGRNCHLAIEKVLALHEQGFLYVVDADIKSFFDTIPHWIIMRLLASEVADGNILDIIEKFLSCGVMEDGVFNPTNIGTPQGGVISPLLANIVLNLLDTILAKQGYRHVRYADDFVIVCRTKAEAEKALALVRQVLNEELGLKLSEEKTRITKYTKGYSFLGFKLSSRSRNLRQKSLKKFKDKIRDVTIRVHNFEHKMIEELNRVIRGTAMYFATSWSTTRTTFRRLDSWIRMRLRCVKFKRKSQEDNHRIEIRTFEALGLLSLESFHPAK